MDKSDQDRLAPPAKSVNNSSSPRLALTIGLVIVVLGAGYYYFLRDPPMLNRPAPPASSLDALITPQPGDNLDTTGTTADYQIVNEPQYPPLPTLDDSDKYLRKHWQELNLPVQIKPWLKKEFLIQRAVSFLDGLASGSLLPQYTPLADIASLRPVGIFKVNTDADTGKLLLDQTNFRRYKQFVDLLESLGPGHVAALFRWLRPLLDLSYVSLGQPSGDPGIQLVAAIDLMLATPEQAGPVELKLESVFYQFADPSLEALPNTQKLLLRMGPQHRAAIKQWLISLKNELIAD